MRKSELLKKFEVILHVRASGFFFHPSNLSLAVWPNIYDLDFFSAKPNQFFKKIKNIGSLGNVVVNEKDISFQKKPEALLPEVFETYEKAWQ